MASTVTVLIIAGAFSAMQLDAASKSATNIEVNKPEICQSKYMDIPEVPMLVMAGPSSSDCLSAEEVFRQGRLG